MDDATASLGAPPLPDVLNALLAFVAEHQRCGDLDGGRDNALVWLTCSCGAQVAHPASASHPATADGASRKCLRCKVPAGRPAPSLLNEANTHGRFPGRPPRTTTGLTERLFC